MKRHVITLIVVTAITLSQKPARGEITCPVGEIMCGATCTNPQSDPKNCGTCGNVCPSTSPACANGLCSK